MGDLADEAFSLRVFISQKQTIFLTHSKAIGMRKASGECGE
jgi:hypothetical protein